MLYYNAYRRSYRPSIYIDNLRVAGARELLGYLSISIGVLSITT